MRIAIIGYGRMGRLIEEVARSRGHEIVCIIDINDQEKYNSTAFKSADVAIEFTTPTTAYTNCLQAWTAGVKVVSGTTGWIEEHMEDVKKACSTNKNTLFWAANFSIGMALFAQVNKYLAHLMNAFAQYDVTENEIHHIHKLDWPSGTAITLAEQIVTQIDRKVGWQKGKIIQPDGQEVPSQTIENNKLTINSIRRGEVTGIHSIVYDSPEDSITITHNAHSRRGFALGAVLAAEYTHTHKGFLTIDNMLKL